MLSYSKKLNNIPISVSLLHEQEYNNLNLISKIKKNNNKARRAFSDKSNDRLMDEIYDFFEIKISYRRKTLKN
jgi:hypothetical protein